MVMSIINYAMKFFSGASTATVVCTVCGFKSVLRNCSCALMSHQSNAMKMNPRAWFNRSRIPVNAAENVTFSANDPASESTPRSELFSTAQMERYGQKLARTHKVSPDKHPYYLLKRLGDNEAVITQNCYELNAGKK
ncbi:hypothetical protein CJ207_08180, partial [Klebsiella aerogenes]